MIFHSAGERKIFLTGRPRPFTDFGDSSRRGEACFGFLHHVDSSRREGHVASTRAKVWTRLSPELRLQFDLHDRPADACTLQVVDIAVLVNQVLAVHADLRGRDSDIGSSMAGRIRMLEAVAGNLAPRAGDIESRFKDAELIKWMRVCRPPKSRQRALSRTTFTAIRYVAKFCDHFEATTLRRAATTTTEAATSSAGECFVFAFASFACCAFCVWCVCVLCFVRFGCALKHVAQIQFCVLVAF